MIDSMLSMIVGAVFMMVRGLWVRPRSGAGEQVGDDREPAALAQAERRMAP